MLKQGLRALGIDFQLAGNLGDRIIHAFRAVAAAVGRNALVDNPCRAFEGHDKNHVHNLAHIACLSGVARQPVQDNEILRPHILFRHEGFFAKEDILAKWKEFGVDLAGLAAQSPALERLVAAQSDNRAKDQICYMCDGDISDKTLVRVQTDKGPVRLCSPHCYFIMYSCLTEEKTGFDAVYVYDMDGETGRPVVKAFADNGKAETEQKPASGSIIGWEILKDKELTTRCGFCDRAVYSQDAARVIAGGLHTWGCCSHCALGVAARTGMDIEVHEKDRLTGEEIIVKSLDGKMASLEPATSVAWFGQRQKLDGTWGSAGCFHQGFFVTAQNLEKWVNQNPYETGRLISISQALANKMKLSPQQIQKACKIGECVPK